MGDPWNPAVADCGERQRPTSIGIGEPLSLMHFIPAAPIIALKRIKSGKNVVLGKQRLEGEV